MGCHALLQGIFLTQGPNLLLLCLLHQQAGFFFNHLESPLKTVVKDKQLVKKGTLVGCGAGHLFFFLTSL